MCVRIHPEPKAVIRGHIGRIDLAPKYHQPIKIVHRSVSTSPPNFPRSTAAAAICDKARKIFPGSKCTTGFFQVLAHGFYGNSGATPAFSQIHSSQGRSSVSWSCLLLLNSGSAFNGKLPRGRLSNSAQGAVVQAVAGHEHLAPDMCMVRKL